MIKLSPSLLAADAAHLGDELEKAVACGCDELYFDVMDGHFVPNLTFGPHILAALKKLTNVPFDVHLMLSEPLSFVDVFAKAGASIITVHAEASGCYFAVRRIRALGLKAGVSLRPGTSAEVLRELVHEIDRVLLMTVEPGFGGQAIQLDVLKKARELREMGFQGEIEVDGGVGPANMQQVAQAGADILVMGTAFFNAADPQALTQAVHAL